MFAYLLLAGAVAMTEIGPEALTAEPAAVPSDGVTLSGEWLYPDAESRVPCVVLAGGTMSHTRDGALIGDNPAGRQRDALRRLAYRLAAAGYATLRWDKRGYGDTPAGPQPVTDEMEGHDVAAAIRAARENPRTGPVIVAGESAGGYFACLAARDGMEADGYILLGALASSCRELFDYNYTRIRRWAEEEPEHLAWARRNAAAALALGHAVDGLFAAAERGDAVYEHAYEGQTYRRPLARIRYELEHTPASLFAHLIKPTLVLQGERDMNVPPRDAETIGRLLREAGNPSVIVKALPSVDHSFQYAAEDEDERLRQRHDFSSFYGFYSEEFYTSCIAWLRLLYPSPVAERRLWLEPRAGISAWGGIQVIDDVHDHLRNPGVDTLEGRIGPLMRAEGGQAHYIDMPAGMFVAEHPHSSESIIYVTRGRFVLCSEGRRHLMREGTLFWFRAGAPTGWEVPFDEPCQTLIVKTTRSDEPDWTFWEYLVGAAARWDSHHEQGEPFSFEDLPRDHPAWAFAEVINPGWEPDGHHGGRDDGDDGDHDDHGVVDHDDDHHE